MTEGLFMRFAALLAAALLVPAVVFAAYSINHRNMPFWRLGAAGFFALFSSSTLSALRDILPVPAVTLLPNVLGGLGYFLCLQALRTLKGDRRLAWMDRLLGAIYLIAVTLIYTFGNTYENRVILISLYIAAFSVLIGVVALRKKNRISWLSDALSIAFAEINAFVSLMRALSAIGVSEVRVLDLAFWDPIFFIWSIAAVFSFYIALFVGGARILAAETERNLERQRELSEKLSDALEAQRDLQKLLLHEVKRPINSIHTTVQVLMESGPIAHKSEFERLRKLTDEATNYLVAIADLEEIDAVLDHPALESIPITSIQSDLQSKWCVQIEAEPDTLKTNVFGDQLLLDVAIGNLVENAFKFGENPENVKIRISMDGRFVVFDIIDDGLGIGKGEQEKVWRKFYKIGSSSGNALKGCGLGLHVVRRISETLHGYCRVIGDKPSTVRFAVPVAAEENAHEKSATNHPY